MARMILTFTAFAVCITAAFAITHQNLTDREFVCWSEEESRNAIRFSDCIDVVTQQVIRDRPLDVPLKFSKDPKLQPDIQVPVHWFSRTGNCFVGIDFAPNEMGYDRASPKDLKRAAQALGVHCVIKAPHRGGVQNVGWRDKMGLIFIGEKDMWRYKNGTVATE
ncbi:MAG: hypothetical protein LQ350_006371 [Teloschistes chrysophthalmus]|nr:MAG: hypothetical protein LQ350_006371 [Niorma chrysophthalma]